MLGMSVRKVALLVATAALFGLAGGAVQAAPAAAATSTKPMDFTVHAETSPLSGAQVMKWDAAKGHWGVTLNLQQPEARAATANDIQAGAYYRITPSLRVGGSLAFGEQQIVPGPKPNPADAGQPRVQLETKFKF
jgi:ABC-type glycerol-3-phosphate transport system substrate-binding protein